MRGDAPQADVVREAEAILAGGGLLIYPTDTLYALGGRALDPDVARRVRSAKGREDRKPLPLIAASLEQVREIATEWPAGAVELAARFWPGPLTLVLASTARLPEGVTAGAAGVAVRVPALGLARALCATQGPLVATSANAAGAPAPQTCSEAVLAVGAAVALALDGGPGQPRPSTIVDLTGRAPRLVREGAVSWAAVREILEGDAG